MEENNTVLQISDLVVRFGDGTITDFKSLDIKKGDFILLKGRNGSGKSTLLRLINLNFDGGKAYCRIVKGSITYHCNDNSKIETTSKIEKDAFSKLRQEIVEVRQDESFASYLTPYEVLCRPSIIAINNSTLDSIEKEKKIEDINQLVSDLYDGYKLNNDVTFSFKKILKCTKKEFSRKKIKAFSGGQQKMIQVVAGFVKATILEANFMLLDEPTNNLDAKNKYYLNLFFQKLMQSGKIGILMVSHCHVFDNINRIMNIDYSKDGSGVNFVADIIEKEKNGKNTLFIPHSDCIEDCKDIIGNIKLEDSYNTKKIKIAKEDSNDLLANQEQEEHEKLKEDSEEKQNELVFNDEKEKVNEINVENENVITKQNDLDAINDSSVAQEQKEDGNEKQDETAIIEEKEETEEINAEKEEVI